MNDLPEMWGEPKGSHKNESAIAANMESSLQDKHLFNRFSLISEIREH